MMSPYCSKGHENPNGSRFCLECDEKLDLPVGKGIHPGLLLGDAFGSDSILRYQIVRQLRHDSFGYTYLARDTKRFSEPCVLKEFAPLLPQTAYALQKAEEVFESEAGVLYKLQHPQIPRYRELFRVNLEGKGYLFLVQDYESGQTYRTLLDARKRQGLRFSEVEVRQLLLQILPVLEYIHSMEVIHRDISPDNLILRSSDCLPLLTDFGLVKQVAATVTSQSNQQAASTPPSPANLVDKLGYAPYDQMQTGMVAPHSDLYALAATVLVLLTSKEPQELIDDNTLTWNWQGEVNLSPTLGAVLDKMLLPRPSKRYQSARQVLQALSEEAGELLSKRATPNHVARKKKAKFFSAPPHPRTRLSSFTLRKLLLALLLIAGTSGLGWWAGNLLLQSRLSTLPRRNQSTAASPPGLTPTSPYPPQEEARRQALFHRAKELGIDKDFLFGDRGLVNQVFYSQHPEWRQRSLTAGSVDQDWRSQWYNTADALLDTLDKHLSPEARRHLGNYTAESGDRAKAEVNKLHLSSRSLYDLTNAAFFHLFPEQRDQDFLNQPIGQVWQGIVADKVKAVKARTAIERMVFDSGAIDKSVSGTLNPGEGKAYIADLAKAQLIQLSLQANPKVLLSVYSPSGKTKILADSSDRAWSGELPEQGFYEFVIVSTASEPVEYQLKVTDLKSHTKSLRQRDVPSKHHHSINGLVIE